MARSRNIKPSFFLNEDLAAVGLEGQLLFAGLWTLADRAGRLEDRPARIKAAIFPYTKIDIDRVLEMLSSVNEPFILRYEVESKRYIQIINFKKHQNPHVREPESTIPAPVEPGASLVPNVPHPSSPIPLPLSPIPHTSSPFTGPVGSGRTPLEDFVKTWNDNCGSLPKATLTGSRKVKIRARWDEKPEMEYWAGVARRLAASSFACGGQWANLDFIIANDTNHVKVMEGKYDNRREEKSNSRPQRFLKYVAPVIADEELPQTPEEMQQMHDDKVLALGPCRAKDCPYCPKGTP